MDFRVAVVGAGPAGIYTADIVTSQHPHATVDLIEQLPAPYGLVRYGVAPDHPRIKEIVKALERILTKDRIRLLANVRVGEDLELEDLRSHYHAVVFATGASQDRGLDIPGMELPGSHGAADFVSWYTGHPDVPETWPLNASSVAVIGAGNVALDVARMLAKPADEQLTTEISDNVHQGLKANKATEIHVFVRRGPAQVKFSPMELRELSHSPSVDVVVEPEGFEIDAAGQQAIANSKSTRLVVNTLLKYLESEPTGAPHRIHIHLCQAPVEILGGAGGITAIRTERTEFVGDGSVRGTGVFVDTPVQAVYRAVGYRSTPVSGLPFDADAHVVRNVAGRVVEEDGSPVPGTYVTGWVKRGPVGLIGHTKSDAAQTVACLLQDEGELVRRVVEGPGAITALLAQRGVDVVTLRGWHGIDATERRLGRAVDRERVKIVSREAMLRAARTDQPSPAEGRPA